MPAEPTVLWRDEQVYVARRESISMTGFARVADHLPGMFGRYATPTHVGHPDELMAVTAVLLDWGQRQGLPWDVTPTPEGEVWGARLEVLLTDPVEQPDRHRWEPALLIRLADPE